MDGRDMGDEDSDPKSQAYPPLSPHTSSTPDNVESMFRFQIPSLTAEDQGVTSQFLTKTQMFHLT